MGAVDLRLRHGHQAEGTDRPVLCPPLVRTPGVTDPFWEKSPGPLRGQPRANATDFFSVTYKHVPISLRAGLWG